jgi:hypothetical protein
LLLGHLEPNQKIRIKKIRPTGAEQPHNQKIRACLDPMERERERAKLLLFCTFFTLLDLSEEFSSRVAESTRLILVKDGFGGDLEPLDRWTNGRRKDTEI